MAGLESENVDSLAALTISGLSELTIDSTVGPPGISPGFCVMSLQEFCVDTINGFSFLPLDREPESNTRIDEVDAFNPVSGGDVFASIAQIDSSTPVVSVVVAQPVSAAGVFIGTAAVNKA